MNLSAHNHIMTEHNVSVMWDLLQAYNARHCTKQTMQNTHSCYLTTELVD